MTAATVGPSFLMGDPRTFTHEDWEDALREAARLLESESPSLLGQEYSQTEMAVVHRFAMHLASLVEQGGIFVDVELHRDGLGTKPTVRTKKNAYSRIDLCVHARDPSNTGNLLALEVKWDDATTEEVRAAQSQALEYLTSRLRYRFAGMLTIPRGSKALLLQLADGESISLQESIELVRIA